MSSDDPSTDDVATSQPDQLPERRVGAALRQARERTGLSLREMAKRLNYSSHSMLSSYETGAVMPSDQVVEGYERELGLSGELVAVLEDARIERHGDAWPRRRPHIPRSAEDQAASPELPSRNRTRRVALWVLLALVVGAVGSVVVWLVTRNTNSASNTPVATSVTQVADGADPKDSGCALDPNVVTLDSAEVDYQGMPAGLAELRYSPQCGVGWSRFEPFPQATIPTNAIIHVDVIRPAAHDLRLPFQARYVGAPVYGNVMRSTEQCIYAAASIEVAGVGLPESRTHCFRGKTPE
jgi:transcriptional regulator with XRE-family HTH domain